MAVLGDISDEQFNRVVRALTLADITRACAALRAGTASHEFEPWRTRYVDDRRGGHHALRSVISVAARRALDGELGRRHFWPHRETVCLNRLRALKVKVVHNAPRTFTTQEAAAEDELQTLKAEVEKRLGQSAFRERVTSNFEGRCCLSEVGEGALLVASHIVPWVARTQSRLDPANGLLLRSLYDRLFDQGFITFDDALRVAVVPWAGTCSPPLRELLDELKGRTAREPALWPINLDYLDYHRTHIFQAVKRV